MDTTIRPLPLLEALAASTRTTSILGLLRAASLAPNDMSVIGRIVAFLASKPRITCLECWGAESTIAADLARIGRAAWANPDLLQLIEPVGSSHRTTYLLHRKVQDLYLAAMAYPRIAVQHDHPDSVPFAERLRLLTLLRALEATTAGIPREVHLEAICIVFRHATEKERSPHWKWIQGISHAVNTGLDDFVAETLYRCEEADDPMAKAPLEGPARQAVRHLVAVLKSERSAPPEKFERLHSKAVKSVPAPTVELEPTPRTNPFAMAASGTVVCAVNDAEEDLTFVVSDADPKRPPRAQRAKGTGLILQSIEDAQFLRHSWHRLGKHEVSAFFERLTALRNGAERRDQLGAALVGIAATTSVALSGMSHIRIQSELTDDWTVDLQQLCLRRRPPRPSRRWKADSTASSWVFSNTDEWRVTLPETTQSILLSHRKRGGISLDTLWARVSPDMTLEHWFGSRFATGDALSRLTSPVVSNILAQDFYEANRDHAEARLLTSSTRSAVPAACTYGSFRFDEVRRTWDHGLHPELGSMVVLDGDAASNAAGSELDVDLARLRKAIERLTRRVNAVAKDGTAWLEHHNLLTALCVVTLFASTGARPVTSPFESIRWFDFSQRLVYVEDKRSGPTQGARLCVLSDTAHQLLVERYLPHLESLRQAIALRAPGFAARLKSLLNREDDCALPLFFFLRSQPRFDWIEVSSSQLDIVCADPWPLPWNLFRHLQSTQLRRKGLPPEIRDALLCHGENGAESHGESSWRVPLNDLAVARPLINSLANDLGLAMPDTAAQPLIVAPNLSDPDFARGQSFGRRARQIRRERFHEAAKRTAMMDIERRLKGRPPQSLSADEWEAIARHMILREDGKAHAMGSLRAETFEEYLAQLWNEKRVRVDAKHRYLPMEEGRAWFDEGVVGAQEAIARLRGELDRLCDGWTRPPQPELAGCLAALELALHCRVSNYAVLAAVVCNLRSVNVVRFQGRYWLEYAYHGEWIDGRPVYRVPISARAAGWIALRQSAKKRLRAVPRVPTALKGLGGIRADRFTEILNRVCGHVAQANALELPCAIAAVLRGTRQSSALPHSDWIRTTFIQAPVIAEKPTRDKAPTPPDDPAPFLANHDHARSVQDLDDASECAMLFDSIQKVLALPRGVSTRDMASQVSQLLKQSSFRRGSAPFVLSHYVHHLLTRPKKTDVSQTLKAKTVQRYWYALKPGVLDFAYNLILPALDDQELTELYQQIVRAAELPPDPSNAEGSGAGLAKRRKLRADTDGGKRAFEELSSFHEFAQGIYGLADPDWSEVSPGICGGSGRPGLILMAEYEAAQATLADVNGCGALDDATLSAAFVLMVCARFGLRIGEAVGLSFSDWIEVNGAIVVLVRSNSIRGLKTEASKRQVPLIGQLNPLELTVAAEIRRRWVLREDPKRINVGLLPDMAATTFDPHMKRIEKRLLALLKTATGNSSSTVHHLRHGFACRLLTLLHGQAYGLGLPCNDEDTSSVRRLLLQADSTDRRTLWAVARLLGHASGGAQSIKSYIHVLDQWLPTPAERLPLVESTEGPGFIDLDAYQRVDLISRLKPIAIAPERANEALFVRHIQYMRLRALRHRDPCDPSGLSLSETLPLEAALIEVTKRLTRRPGTEEAELLLSRVSETRWRALASLASTARNASPEIANARWLPTIGASRQVVLFHPEHFDWMAQFVTALSLDARDCALVHRNTADAETLDLANTPVLQAMLSPSRSHGKTFQLDRGVEFAPERVYPNRMVMLALPGGQITTSHELLLLWTAWIVAGQAPRS